MKASILLGHGSHYISGDIEQREAEGLAQRGPERGGQAEIQTHACLLQSPYSFHRTSKKAKAQSTRPPRKAVGSDSSAQLDQMKQENEKAVPSTRSVSFWISYKSLDGSAKIRDFTFSP